MGTHLTRQDKTEMASTARIVTSSQGLRFVLDPFAFRQFDDPSYSGTVFPSTEKDAFVDAFVAHVSGLEGEDVLVPGYAEFCKHVFMPNFVDEALVGAVHITPDNQNALCSGHHARRPEELPVLTRWFPADADGLVVPKAAFLDVILYSSAQIAKEHDAMPASGGPPPPAEDYDWGIISIKGQAVDYEIPMAPITMLRNALGAEEGGSGVSLDPEKYRASVEFWDNHASIR